MSNKEKAQLVPKLRFPDFRTADGWGVPKLGSIGFFTGGGTPSKEREDYWTGGNPWVSSSDISEDGIQDIAISRYISDEAIQATATKVVPANSILLVSRVGVGKLAISKAPICTSQDFTNFTPAKANVVFLAYCLKSLKAKLLAFNQGMAIKGFTKDDISNLDIPLPKLEEQQKIADCLTSLDELIAAQARKLVVLKTYKKGLMQRLFPREGETQPRLRFPEFRDAPEWVSGSLGSIFETTSGGTPSRSEARYWNGSIPWITTSLVNFGVITEAEEFISKDGLNNSSAKLLPKETVLIAMYGQGKTRGQVALLGVEAATNQACAAILPKEGINPYFVFLNLTGRYEEFRKLSNSGGQENLSQGLIREIPFAYPLDKEEQKLIADCFTAFDNLFTTAREELETLKNHKNGLMQQLFPHAKESI